MDGGIVLTFEHILYIGLAGFIGVNINVWLAKPLNNIRIGKLKKIYLPWGSIIVNALSACALGIVTTQFPRDSPMFQYLCIGLIGSIGSSYALFSSNLIKRDRFIKLKIAQIARLVIEIILDVLFLIVGMQVGTTLI